MDAYSFSVLQRTSRRIFAGAVILLLAALSPLAAHAQETTVEYPYVGEAFVHQDALVGLIEGVHLFVEDGVTDGCWTNAREIANRIVLIFAAENISATINSGDWGFSPMDPRLDLRISGRRVDGGCLASAQMALYFSNNTVLNFAHENRIASIRTSQSNIMWITSQAMVGPENIDDVVDGWVSEWIGVLAMRIAGQRVSEQVVRANFQWGFSQ